MASAPTALQNVGKHVGPTFHRQVHFRDDYSDEKVQCSVLQPRMRSSGCDGTVVERGKQFCEPSLLDAEQNYSQIAVEEVEATVIAPVWPAQSWFQKFINMLVANPVVLPKSERIMIKRAGVKPEPLKNVKWKICACRASGKRN